MTTSETTLPLGRLVPCPDNVRRTHNEAAIAEMAASITHHGLIHNLVVRPAPKGGRFEVVAGGRRLAALRRLLKDGSAVQGVVVTKDFPVRVVVRADGGTELSLAENIQREAMTPVDEILAYRDLAAKGEDVENVAARFGQSPITVRQRLRLAGLSPRILDALRAGELTLEQAKALAISDDHGAQEQAWFEQPGWNRDPYSLRAFLTQSHVRASDRLARYVGLEHYEAAGGTVQRDLFADDQTTYLTDRPLLVKLATARLEVTAAELREQGWKWAEVCLDRNGLHGAGYGRIHVARREFTEAEQAERAALAGEYDLLMEGRDDYAEDDPALEVHEARLQEIESRLDMLDAAVLAYAPAAMAVAGCLVGIGHDGGIDIAKGLLKPEDGKALAALRAGDSGRGEQEGAEDGLAGEDAPVGRTGYAAPLVEELTAIRTAALRVELANRPQVALAALLLPLVSRLFHGHAALASHDSVVEIRGEFRDLVPAIRDAGASRPLAAWQEMVEGWGNHVPSAVTDLWPWLLEQDNGRLLDLLALVTAANLNAVSVRQEGRGRMVQADTLAGTVGLDMGAWWAPQQPFLSRLSKAEIGALLRQAGCPEAAAKTVEKAPKDGAVAMAERELAGKGWLPELYRRAPGAPEPGCPA